jgi:exonuclease III
VEAPYLICLSEHHLREYEITNTHIPTYRLGAHYCRKNLKQGGICIYVKESIQFFDINLLKHNTDQDVEIAAIQLNIQKIRMIFICVYRAPSGNFDLFLNRLENILNSLHRWNSEFIICRDININYLESSFKKNQLNNLLDTYNLTDTISFPTRITNNSVTLIDNVFIDNNKGYTIHPLPNGLSDHGGQNLTILNNPIKTYKAHSYYKI